MRLALLGARHDARVDERHGLGILLRLVDEHPLEDTDLRRSKTRRRSRVCITRIIRSTSAASALSNAVTSRAGVRRTRIRVLANVGEDVAPTCVAFGVTASVCATCPFASRAIGVPV